MPRIESWSVAGGGDPYTAPELRTLHLQGIVYGHPKFEEGHPIVTTPIIGIADGGVVTKSGSVYQLGAVDTMYEDQFPGARDRLLAVLKQEKNS